MLSRWPPAGLPWKAVNQRRLGATIVALVLLGAAVPNLSTHRVTGRPVAMLVAGPPSSGTCVITMADPWQAIAQPGQADHDVIDYPTAVYGSCNRPIAGEVVSVDVAASPSARIAATDYLNEATSCALDAIGYTGAIAPVVDQSAGGPGIVWEPAVAFQTTLVGPNSLQRDAGKHWSACIVGSGNAQPYLGRLHNALTTGVLPPQFGSCWPSVDLRGPEQSACDAPHAVELLGSTSLGGKPVSVTEIRRTCTIYASRALRNTDPTRHGAIRLEILDSDHSPAIVRPPNGPLHDTYVACIATAPNGRQFNGTLIGLGKRPLPLV